MLPIIIFRVTSLDSHVTQRVVLFYSSKLMVGMPEFCAWSELSWAHTNKTDRGVPPHPVVRDACCSDSANAAPEKKRSVAGQFYIQVYY